MKALVVRQPWASLIALGVKTIETRPSPPNGPMRPDGVRGLPGCRLERGERIAIVAGKDKACITEIGPLPWAPLTDGTGIGIHLRERLVLGAVVCTAVVDDVLPVFHVATVMSYDVPFPNFQVNGPDLLTYCGVGGEATDMRAQIPFGEFAPGRWGWMLTDVKPCAPVPVKGRQGVFMLPDDVAEALS